jgi:hypothetical protein
MGKFRPSIPLSQEELEKKGIWDFNRLSQPYIMDTILQDKFGSIWMDVASTYFNKNQYQRYEFKEEYATDEGINGKTDTSEASRIVLVARIAANFLKSIADINALSLVTQVPVKARCLEFASTFILYLK